MGIIEQKHSSHFIELHMLSFETAKLSYLVLYTKIISMHNGFVKEQSLLQEMTVLHTLTTSCWMTFQVM